MGNSIRDFVYWAHRFIEKHFKKGANPGLDLFAVNPKSIAVDFRDSFIQMTVIVLVFTTSKDELRLFTYARVTQGKCLVRGSSANNI